MTLSKKGGWENGYIWNVGKKFHFLRGEGTKTNVIFLHVDKFLIITLFFIIQYKQTPGKWELNIWVQIRSDLGNRPK